MQCFAWWSDNRVQYFLHTVQQYFELQIRKYILVRIRSVSATFFYANYLKIKLLLFKLSKSVLVPLWLYYFILKINYETRGISIPFCHTLSCDQLSCFVSEYQTVGPMIQTHPDWLPCYIVVLSTLTMVMATTTLGFCSWLCAFAHKYMKNKLKWRK